VAFQRWNALNENTPEGDESMYSTAQQLLLPPSTWELTCFSGELSMPWRILDAWRGLDPTRWSRSIWNI